MSILILGFKSCGKSTLGQSLSQDLSLPFYDTDELIAKAFQKASAREVFVTLGEKSFRNNEQKILMDLSKQKACIVATGGGIVEHETCNKWIEKFKLRIFLDAPLEEIKARIDPSYVFYHQLEERYALRYKHYLKLSNIHIKIAGLNLTEISLSTLEAIHPYGQ